MVEPCRLLAVQVNRSVPAAGAGHSGALGLAVFLVGLGLVGYGLAPAVRFKIWRATAERTTARVIENVPVTSSKGITLWAPIVEFRASGEDILSLLRESAALETWPLGGQIDVAYDPIDPYHARFAHTRFQMSAVLLAGLSVIGIYLALTP